MDKMVGRCESPQKETFLRRSEKPLHQVTGKGSASDAHGERGEAEQICNLTKHSSGSGSSSILPLSLGSNCHHTLLLGSHTHHRVYPRIVGSNYSSQRQQIREQRTGNDRTAVARWIASQSRT